MESAEQRQGREPPLTTCSWRDADIVSEDGVICLTAVVRFDKMRARQRFLMKTFNAGALRRPRRNVMVVPPALFSRAERLAESRRRTIAALSCAIPDQDDGYHKAASNGAAWP